MNLHSDKEAFKEIIALAAEHFGYEQSHVEKDYWVSKILRDISMSEYADKTYFKRRNFTFQSLRADRTLLGRFGLVRVHGR